MGGMKNPINFGFLELFLVDFLFFHLELHTVLNWFSIFQAMTLPAVNSSHRIYILGVKKSFPKKIKKIIRIDLKNAQGYQPLWTAVRFVQTRTMDLMNSFSFRFVISSDSASESDRVSEKYHKKKRLSENVLLFEQPTLSCTYTLTIDTNITYRPKRKTVCQNGVRKNHKQFT